MEIKWGIIGAGRIARKFAADLLQTPNCVLHAVASTSLERAHLFATEFNARFAFGAYKEIFSSGIDVIYIATPHSHHKEHTVLCLNNNTPVLCEKPFAMNELEVFEMVNLAKSKKIFLMEAIWTRFLPSTQKTLEIITQNKIGKIVTLQADFGFKAHYDEIGRVFNPKLGGGALLDIGIYPAFLSLLILGYPSQILATSIFAKTGVDFTTSFIYKYDNSATAVLNCTFGAETSNEAHIFGEKGKIIIKGRFHEAKTIIFVATDGETETFEFPRETFGYNYEIEEVNNCLRNSKIESDILPLSFSKKLIHLLDKTREAAKIVY